VRRVAIALNRPKRSTAALTNKTKLWEPAALQDSEIEGRTFLLADRLAWLAMSLWLMSLLFTAYALGNGSNRAPGWGVLLGGWLGPLSGTVAWFANPAFLWAFRGVCIREPSAKAAVLAVVLALDTLRIDSLLINEAGHRSSLYGFGWGAVLWALSLCLMLMATAVARWAEGCHYLQRPLTKSRFFQVSVALFSVTFVASTYYALWDRVRGNADERSRITGLAFKRGPICEAGEPALSSAPIQLVGGLEIRFTGDGIDSAPITEKDGVRTLIDWGVPVVQFEGRDYKLFRSGNDRELVSTPTVAPPRAVLHVHSANAGGTKSFRIRLVDAIKKRDVLDQTWRLVPRGAHFCPNMATYPKAEHQPRKLLFEALGIPAIEPLPPWQHRTTLKATLQRAEVVTQPPPLRALESSFPSAHGTPSNWGGNQGCPSNIGWAPRNVHDRHGGRTEWPFKIDQKAWHFGGKHPTKAWCERDAVYLYDLSHSKEGARISIDARSLPEFDVLWQYVIDIDGPIGEVGADDIRLVGVKNNQSHIALTLWSERSKTGVVAVTEALPP
jgi:hypothetical protein